MVAVAVINLGIIGVTVLFSKRNESQLSRMIKAFDLFLSVFTIIIVSTSISKILLYIAEYGLTHKRLYVFIADLILVVAFAMITVRLFKKNFPYMKVILGFACSMITLMSLVGTDSLIANYNVEMYLRGNLKTVDVDQLEDMGLAALKPLHKLSQNEKEGDKILNYRVKEAVANVFYYNAVYYGTPEEYMENGVIDRGFTSLDEYLALKYAEDNFGSLSDIHLNYGWWYSKENSDLIYDNEILDEVL